jgi:hypothetical protein
MAKAKNSFIGTDLEWAEKKLKEWRDYMDANPFNKLGDRTIGTTIVTKEVQGKYLQETMKNYLSMLEIVDKLREQESMKVEKFRGGDELSPLENGEI